MLTERDKKPNQAEIEKNALNIFRNGALNKLEVIKNQLSFLKQKPTDGKYKEKEDFLEKWGVPIGEEFITHMGYDKEEGDPNAIPNVDDVVKRIKGFERTILDRSFEYCSNNETGKANEFCQNAFSVLDDFCEEMRIERFLEWKNTNVVFYDS